MVPVVPLGLGLGVKGLGVKGLGVKGLGVKAVGVTIKTQLTI